MNELELFKKCLKDEAQAILDTIDNFGSEVIDAVNIMQIKRFHI